MLRSSTALVVAMLIGPAPMATAQAVTEIAMLASAAPAAGAGLGVSVALSGDGTLALVGAADGARFYESTGEGWRSVRTIPAPAGARGTGAVALAADGRTALIDGDVVEVWSRREGAWEETAVLVPPSADRPERGRALALSADGTVAVIGSPFGGVDRNGVVLVHRHTEAGWALQTELHPPEGISRASFGAAVAVDALGSRIVVGAPRARVDRHADAGLAFVFDRGDEPARRVTAHRAPSPARRDFFGSAVAISGDGLDVLIGAWGDDVDGEENAGSVLALRWAEGRFVAGDLIGSGGVSGVELGRSVALSGDGRRALVGASEGTARIFSRTGESFREGRWLAAESGDGAIFAVALSSDGAVGLLGAPRDTVRGYDAGGSARVFLLSGEDGRGVPSPSPALRLDAELEASMREREALARSFATSLVLLPVLVGVGALGYGLAMLAGAGLDTSSSSLGDAVGLVLLVSFGTPFGVIASIALPPLIVTAVGQALGGRGNFVGSLLGSAIGAAVGVGIVAGLGSLAFAPGAELGSTTGLLVTGACLGALAVGVGAVLGYSLWDAAERAEAAEVLVVPVIAAHPEGASIGIAGAF